MSERDTVAVRTYVPRYQKEQWATHADQLEMSQSEFVRTMVQAGRVDFEIPDRTDREAADSSQQPVPTDDFETQIVQILEREVVLDWDELVTALVSDLEDKVDAGLQSLQERNRIRYSGRNGGYELIDDGE